MKSRTGPRSTTTSVAQGAHKEATGNVGAVRISCLSANEASWEQWHQRQPVFFTNLKKKTSTEKNHSTLSSLIGDLERS